MWALLLVMMILLVGIAVFINRPQFGKTPYGQRLERIKRSPNYRDGKFQNQTPTPRLADDTSLFGVMFNFLFRKGELCKPGSDIPAVKTDLRNLDRSEDIMVWFGHSSCFIQIDGKRILIDPVFSESASPLSFTNKAFRGTNLYKPEDIPDIDYLIITHDHWDHLDYPSVMKLKPRIGKIICPLGVGAHFEHWKFDVGKLVEMDWDEHVILDEILQVYCLPARHFSGRSFTAEQSLWASFLLKTPGYKIYVSGDGGYDARFAAIGEQFGPIDLVILEDGQYNKAWRYIHMLPDEVVKAARDLRPVRVLPVHHSKFMLANHPWEEPLVKISEATQKDGFILLTPLIGQPVRLKDSTYVFDKWWESVSATDKKQ